MDAREKMRVQLNVLCAMPLYNRPLNDLRDPNVPLAEKPSTRNREQPWRHGFRNYDFITNAFPARGRAVGRRRLLLRRPQVQQTDSDDEAT